MLINQIDGYIAAALKTDKDLCAALRLIKNELLKAQKSGKEYNSTVEAKILMRMVAQRREAFEIYTGVGREDLAAQEKKELDILLLYAPEELTDEQVTEYTSACVSAYLVSKPEGYALSMRDMKPIMDIVHEKYPTASGKVISKTVQDIIKR